MQTPRSESSYDYTLHCPLIQTLNSGGKIIVDRSISCQLARYIYIAFMLVRYGIISEDGYVTFTNSK